MTAAAAPGPYRTRRRNWRAMLIELCVASDDLLLVNIVATPGLLQAEHMIDAIVPTRAKRSNS